MKRNDLGTTRRVLSAMAAASPGLLHELLTITAAALCDSGFNRGYLVENLLVRMFEDPEHADMMRVMYHCLVLLCAAYDEASQMDNPEGFLWSRFLCDVPKTEV